MLFRSIGSLQPDVDSMLDWNTLTNDDFAPASSEEKADFIQQRKSVSYWSDAWRRLRKNVVAMVALGVIVLLILFAFVGPMLVPYGYEQRNLGAENLYPHHYTLEEQEQYRQATSTLDPQEAVEQARAEAEAKGEKLTEAGPSVPVEIIGMGEVPDAGDDFHAVADERMARELAEQRKSEQKNALNSNVGKVTLEDLFSQIQAGEMKNLNVIVKADVQGSAEAVKSSLEKLSNEEVRVRVIHCAVGAINESDVMLATTSGAIIVGFNVRPDANAKESAARSHVDMRMYRVIYDAINEIEAAMKGMLTPKFKEVDLGRAEVRNVFRITGVGMVAGCYVLDGKMQRGAQMRLLRDNIVIYDGAIASLQRFKDSVKEVAAGYECGITFEKFQDIKEGDIVEAYLMEEVER